MWPFRRRPKRTRDAKRPDADRCPEGNAEPAETDTDQKLAGQGLKLTQAIRLLEQDQELERCRKEAERNRRQLRSITAQLRARRECPDPSQSQ